MSQNLESSSFLTTFLFSAVKIVCMTKHFGPSEPLGKFFSPPPVWHYFHSLSWQCGTGRPTDSSWTDCDNCQSETFRHMKGRLNNQLCVCLFISLVLHYILKDISLLLTTARIMMEETGQCPGGNSHPFPGCWKTIPCLARAKATLTWTWTHRFQLISPQTLCELTQY